MSPRSPGQVRCPSIAALPGRTYGTDPPPRTAGPFRPLRARSRTRLVLCGKPCADVRLAASILSMRILKFFSLDLKP